MTIEETISYYESRLKKYNRRLDICKNKPNTLATELDGLNRKVEATELAIEALSQFVGVNKVIDDIESTPWYRINECGDIVEGANNRDEAWYKAADILKICDDYRIN